MIILSESQLLLLHSQLIAETDIAKRLRLIFSCTCSEGEELPETARVICPRLGCLTLCLLPLRSRASLYLSSLNIELGKQIIGFDPQAMEQLRSYDGPNNYTQFKQVLQELAALTDSAYIRRSAVIEVLTRERSLHRKGPLPAGRDQALYTLEEITRQAIRQTLDALGGNQTAAARQLGISRTTLWRYLSPRQ